MAVIAWHVRDSADLPFRHAFLDSGIDHVELADHVVGVLVEKLGGVSRTPGSLPHWASNAVDFLALIRNASGLLRMHLEVAAGDHFLVLTGWFPGFLAERETRSGAGYRVLRILRAVVIW